ncbi:MAG: DUF308 domain-containing protein [Treponema sp.]|nr:DUF308 domain-containing protein [Treponema sp.]
MGKTNFFFGILAAVVGLIVLIAPEASIKVVVVLLGAAAVMNGFYDLLKVRNFMDTSRYKLNVMIHSLISIAIGLLAIFLPFVLFNTAEAVFRLMLYVLAVYMIVAAVMRFFVFAMLKGEGLGGNIFLLESVSEVIAAVLLFIMASQHIGIIIVRILGLAVFVLGSCYAIYAYRNASIVIEPESVEDDVVSSETVANEKPSSETVHSNDND